MVPDYTPNLGVFWYFFAEMFEHFRSFFLVVFQMNIFLYAVPLAIRFKYVYLIIFTADIYLHNLHTVYSLYTHI